MWLIASLLPIIYWACLWAEYGWEDMMYLMLICAGIVPILLIATLVLWLQPSDWLFERVMSPLLHAYWWVVGVDPNDPDLMDVPSEESEEGEASEESGDVDEAREAFYHAFLDWVRTEFGEDEGEGGEEEEALDNFEDDNVSSEHTELW